MQICWFPAKHPHSKRKYQSFLLSLPSFAIQSEPQNANCSRMSSAINFWHLVSRRANIPRCFRLGEIPRQVRSLSCTFFTLYQLSYEFLLRQIFFSFCFGSFSIFDSFSYLFSSFLYIFFVQWLSCYIVHIIINRAIIILTDIITVQSINIFMISICVTITT